MELLEAIQEAREAGESRERQAQVKAHAYSVACNAVGVGVKDLTPTMRVFADAVERRMNGEGTLSKSGGFSLPDVEERKPNIR